MKPNKKSSSISTAFIDFALNAAILFAILFVIVIIQINQKNKNDVAKIDTKDSFLITIDWNSIRNYDLDLYIKGPDGQVLFFRNLDSTWGTLERDDLGHDNDTRVVNGLVSQFNFNREVMHLRNMMPGRYVVNIHFYSNKEKGYGRDDRVDDLDVAFDFIQLEPRYKVIYNKKGELSLSVKEEMTLFSFEYDKTIPVTIDTITQEQFVNDLLGLTAASGGYPF